MAKHWIVNQLGYMVDRETDKVVAHIRDPKDAPLILAAPDLLEACKEALKLLNGELPTSDHDRVCAKLRSAITKACDVDEFLEYKFSKYEE